MQAYEPGFASAYNQYLAPDFAEAIGPHIVAFYRAQAPATHAMDVLDVGCGTGQLARYFLDQGYRVTGLDLSANMLTHARKHTAAYLADGRASFIEADASNFQLDRQFGLVVSTFDALNHLPDEDALRRCFGCVAATLVSGGFFLFDLNTRVGLTRWSEVDLHLADGPTRLQIRGSYDGRSKHASMTFSGIACDQAGQAYDFEEVVVETIFDLEQVRLALLDAGWRTAYFARREQLDVPLEDPEQYRKVQVVARM